MKQKLEWGMVAISTILFFSNMIEKDYLSFFDPRELIPRESTLAKVLEGDTTGCITKPNQTKPVTLDQIKSLKEAKTPREKLNILGNGFCETSLQTIKYITTTGRELHIKLDKSLDYDFSQSQSPKPQGLHNRLPVSGSAKSNSQQEKSKNP